MKIHPGLVLAVLLPLCACARDALPPGAAAAATTRAAPATPIDPKDARVALAARIPGTKPEDLRATPVPGIFELTHGSDITYVSADGKYAFAGDMYRVTEKGEFPNVTEVRRRELRLQMLGDIPETQMIVFGPANAKHTVTVFTDFDCPWCRRLHSQIAEYNKLGIRVRYMFYPRTGPHTESWFKAEAVWCAKDRKATFTRAKLGEDVTRPASCTGTPVAREYELGRELGISGTPGMVMESGELVPGYLTPATLLAHLNGAPLSDQD